MFFFLLSFFLSFLFHPRSPTTTTADAADADADATKPH